jgi:hypothetical protein
VSNWSILRNYKNIWNSTKDSVTTGMFVTRRPRGAKPQVKAHKGRPAGPTPWPADHTLSQLRPRLDSYAPKSVYKSIPCSKVGGDREEWPTGHVDGHPTIHQVQTDSIKSVEAPLDLYIRILTVEFRTYHTILVVLQL